MPLDVQRILRSSKLRVGAFRATGIPAILLGVAAIVVAAGIARLLGSLRFAPARGRTGLLESLRPEPPSLRP